jgi:two-component system, chemotaxis family, chemotaxis protein CheY
LSIAAVLEDEHETPPHLLSVGEPVATSREHVAEVGAAKLRTVLIVEDEPALRESLRDIFRSHGYAALEAADGAVALQILRDRHVDVLILDLHLPKIDGVGVLRQIDAPPPMVIIHSAFEFYSADQVAEGVGPKVFRMVQKPIPPPKLLSAVADAVAELDGLDG